MPTSERYSRVPLFERLCDAHPEQTHEQPPLRMLAAAALRASVARELVLLFNVRSATGERNRVLSAIDYGLPDWSALSAANPFDRATIARGMVRAVAAFEPRLRLPQVTVMPSCDGPQSLYLRLTGWLAGEEEANPVAFGIELGAAGASVSVERVS